MAPAPKRHGLSTWHLLLLGKAPGGGEAEVREILRRLRQGMLAGSTAEALPELPDGCGSTS
jgi:hypothetical protein